MLIKKYVYVHNAYVKSIKKIKKKKRKIYFNNYFKKRVIYFFDIQNKLYVMIIFVGVICTK